MNDAQHLIQNLRFDCFHFLGDRPCAPHVNSGKVCSCDVFKKVTKRGVIIKLGAAGDVLRTTPLLRALNPLETGSKILWVTHSPELLPQDACEAVKPTASTIARLMSGDWDFCWNLDKDTEACSLAAATRAKELKGYTLRDGVSYPIDPAAWHKFATGIDNPYSRANRLSYVEEIFQIVGLPYQREEYWLRTPNADARRLAGQLISGRGWIGLNTGAGRRWPSRIWPEDYWRQLIVKLRAEGLQPIVLGGPEEADLNERLVRDTGCATSGIQSLETFYAIVGQCECIVTSVTQAMHLAIGSRVPIVLFNNIFNSYEFELYDRGEVLAPSPLCECYYAPSCTTGRNCIQEITPEQTMEAVRKAITKSH